MPESTSVTFAQPKRHEQNQSLIMSLMPYIILYLIQNDKIQNLTQNVMLNLIQNVALTKSLLNEDEISASNFSSGGYYTK